jgi:lytic murein transglycosylase
VRVARAALPLALGLCALLQMPAAVLAQGSDAFRSFVEALWPEAEAMGIRRATFDAAFKDVTPDLTLPDLVLPGKSRIDAKGQAEFTRTPAEYLDTGLLARLAGQGKALVAKHRAALDKIELEIGVPRHVVLAIWGRESAFTTPRSPHYAIRALATQAFTGRRKEMFRNELLHALKLLENKVRTRETMTSSWAGAMGLTQFMPSEYDALAYDLDGDGRSDIWGSVPDALASAANQLKGRGWITGQTWGYEVRLPAGASCLLEGPPNAKKVRDWVKLGVVRVRSQAFPAHALDQQAFILTPGGAHGPAFLALENFMVVKRYNMSDLYALFVGNLADRIAGGGDFHTKWGKVRQLSARGIEEIQRRLEARGYAIAKIDGKAGMNTRALIGAYQKTSGLKVDCWPSEALLSSLRGRSGPEREARPPAGKGKSKRASGGD